MVGTSSGGRDQVAGARVVLRCGTRPQTGPAGTQVQIASPVSAEHHGPCARMWRPPGSVACTGRDAPYPTVLPAGGAPTCGGSPAGLISISPGCPGVAILTIRGYWGLGPCQGCMILVGAKRSHACCCFFSMLCSHPTQRAYIPCSQMRAQHVVSVRLPRVACPVLGWQRPAVSQWTCKSL